jgi:AcrR family transcriptional regulator
MRALPGQSSRLPDGARSVTRDQVAADQRRRIIEAAAELIAKRGYHGTTIELIIRRAKVGYATFYKNFSSKEECLVAIFDGAGEVLRPTLRNAYESHDGPWAERVAIVLGTLFELIVENPAPARVCLVEALTAGPIAVARYERMLANFEPLLLPGRKIKPGNAELPDTLEATLFGGVFWIAYQRLIVGEVERLIELLPETIELVLSPYVGEAEAVRVADELGGKSAEAA